MGQHFYYDENPKASYLLLHNKFLKLSNFQTELTIDIH